MPLNIDSIGLKWVIGDEKTFQTVENQPALEIFSKQSMEFLNAVSHRLLKDPAAKIFSDLITFAFWCRTASLTQLAKKYHANKIRIGRGIIFHIAPSNVPVNFAYSLTAGLLAGNINIVRLPSKQFEQVEIICRAIRETIEDFPEMSPYIYMIQYNHEKEINDLFSKICDVRVIWGGDSTIQTIRQSPIKPRASEITFADRYSISLIQADKYLQAEDKNRIAKDFFNDTYLNDQNACTAPRLIVWLGENIDSARNEFWLHLKKLIDVHYNLQAVKSIDKLVNSMIFSINYDTKIQTHDNNLVTAEVFKLDDQVMNFIENCGYFIEYKTQNLEDILPICDERCQTLSFYGLDASELQKFIQNHRPRGVDRIVPIGKTLDFSLTWDGYDLIYQMSRIIGN